MTQTRNVLIVDDHPMFRQGLKALLEQSDRFAVVGEASTPQEAMRLLALLQPPLVTVDISLHEANGLTLVREILGIAPEAGILVISMHTKMDYVTAAFQSGARGYVAKESEAEKILLALEAISKGKLYLDDALSASLVNKLNSPDEQDTLGVGYYERLTSREQEILRLVAGGMSSKDIAERLFISPKTVENHRASIMSKLRLHNVVDLVRYAFRYGLSSLDD